MNQQYQEFVNQSATKMRGRLDPEIGKELLSLGLFYRYLFNDFKDYMDELLGNQKYQDLTDEEARPYKEKALEELGFFIYPSQFGPIEDTTVKDMIERIRRIEWLNIDITDAFESMNSYFEDLENKSDRNADEVLADVLTYPIKQKKDFSLINQELVKGFRRGYLSGRDFDLPESLSELLAKLAVQESKEAQDIYNFNSLGGSLVLKVKENLDPEDKSINIYGQEGNQKTYLAGLINWILNDIPASKIHLSLGNILKDSNRYSKNNHEIIISHIPFGMRWSPEIDSDQYYEFIGSEPVVSSSKIPIFHKAHLDFKADLDFVLHALSRLTEDGTAVLLTNTSILRVGNREKAIREFLIENNYIDSIIQLPSKVLNGTGIAPSIMVLKKNKPNEDVFFIDASEEFEELRPSLNGLSEKNIEDILETFKKRENVLNKSQTVGKKRIKEEEYNLLPSLYIETEEENNFENSKKLKELVKSIQIGNYRKSSKPAEDGSNNAYVVNINNLKNHLITDVSTLNEVSSNNLRKMLEPGDIVLSKNFDSYEGGINQIEESDKAIIAGANTFILKVDTDKIDPLYLLYFLKSTSGKSQIEKRIPKAGRIRGIDAKTLENLEIPVVSMEKQKEIGKNFLKLLDERRELKRQLEKKELEIESFPLDEIK